MDPLFTKIMMMTTSDNDGVTLVAIRKANAMLAAANLNWEEFIKGKPAQAQPQAGWHRPPPRQPPPQQPRRPPPWEEQQRAREPPRQQRPPWADEQPKAKPEPKPEPEHPDYMQADEDDIDEMFEAAFARVRPGGFRDFLESVHDWWESRGYLTPRQFEVVQKAAGR